jgi:hypothetical protein
MIGEGYKGTSGLGHDKDLCGRRRPTLQCPRPAYRLRGAFEISCQACSSSSKSLASFKSRVSKPSVNQP